jgi:predicted RND superfamily exporter protein
MAANMALARMPEGAWQRPALAALAVMADPTPPSPADFPEALTTRFVGRTGKHLQRVYGKGALWDMDALEQFVRQVQSVDPRITGHPIQTYYASRQMQQSYVHAGIYAALAVCMVLILDFGSVRRSLLALLPVALSFVQLFGLMGLLGLPLNAANMIVLPLLLGIGIDYGVHIVHDYRRTSGAWRLSGSTASAVMLSSLTTMVGFGSMMMASHLGLRSLGRVLTLGVTFCLVSSLVVLPALLAWMARRNAERLDKDKTSSEDGEGQSLSQAA